MDSVKAIDDISKSLRTSIANWERQIAVKKEDLAQLGAERAQWRKKVIRDGDETAQTSLDAVRSVVSFVTQELEDYEDELNRARAELEQLAATREEAVRCEVWSKWLEESKEAVKEAQALEKFWDGFITVLTPHRERLPACPSWPRERAQKGPRPTLVICGAASLPGCIGSIPGLAGESRTRPTMKRTRRS